MPQPWKATGPRASKLQLLKPTHLEPVLPNKRGHHNEKPACCKGEKALPAATKESPHAAKKTQHDKKQRGVYMSKKKERKKFFEVLILAVSLNRYKCPWEGQ